MKYIDIITKAGKYSPFILGTMTVHSYIFTLSDNSKNKLIAELQTKAEKAIELNKTLLDNKIADESLKNTLIGRATEAGEKFSSSNETKKTILELLEEKKNNQSIWTETDFESHQQRLDFAYKTYIQETQKGTEIVEEMNTMINKFKGSGSGSQTLIDSIKDFFISYQDFLTTLSLEQKAALINILFSIFIIFCFMSILTIFYGDWLIVYYKLESEYY